MKILFIGIFDSNEPNTAFRNALKEASTSYEEIAHNVYGDDKPSLHKEVIEKSMLIQPDLVFMQLQGSFIIYGAALEALKKHSKYIVQWTGDARQPLPQHYIDFGKQIDLSLFTNQDDVDVLTSKGVNADYLQVSADHTIYTPDGSVSADVPEIVFMGNNYNKTFELSDYRFQMCKFLKDTYGDRFGVYGANYPDGMAKGNLMFNQMKEAEVYRSCKIAINCSHYDLKKYTSDRFFRILLSGAFCLSKEFPEMEEYSPGKNFATFSGCFSDLKDKIDYYLNNDFPREEIAFEGCMYAHSYCKWPERIKQLLKLVKKWNGNAYQN